MLLLVRWLRGLQSFVFLSFGEKGCVLVLYAGSTVVGVWGGAKLVGVVVGFG